MRNCWHLLCYIDDRVPAIVDRILHFGDTPLMNNNQYHRVLLGLDEVLRTFGEAGHDLSEDDRIVKEELDVIRSKILKAESGHPFPFKSRLTNEQDSTHDMTRAPWFS